MSLRGKCRRETGEIGNVAALPIELQQLPADGTRTRNLLIMNEVTDPYTTAAKLCGRKQARPELVISNEVTDLYTMPQRDYLMIIR